METKCVKGRCVNFGKNSHVCENCEHIIAEISGASKVPTKVYPDITFIDLPDRFELRTILRKEKDGVWYDILVVSVEYKNRKRVFSFSNTGLLDFVNKFHRNVYQASVLTVITPGSPFFPVSENQESEADRLLKPQGKS